MTDPYVDDGCICQRKHVNDSLVFVPLCNFSARIVEDVIHDDGVEPTRHFFLQGKLADGTLLPRTEVTAANFAGMSWIVPSWGTCAVVYAGTGTKDHLRTALQLLSGNVPRRTIYAHTGWREVGSSWHYLHAGGAIGPEGLTPGIEVSLLGSLSKFELPGPSKRDRLVTAVKASLRIVDNLVPDRIGFPLLGTIYRAVLGDTDFSLHIAGPTGVYKSELVALAQQHWGAGLDARNLPGSWSSTGNSLEGMASSAKDAVLVVDDFAPNGSSH